MSFKRMMINDAAVRQVGELRFLIQRLPSEMIRDLRLKAFVVSAAGVLVFGGCAARQAEPVLEPYREESVGQETGLEEDLKKSSAPVSGTGGTESDKEVTREESQDTGQDSLPEESQKAAGKGSQEAARDSSGDITPEGGRETVTVHVCGAVKNEGVYTLAAGSRAGDAVEAAGGFSEDADTAILNLAIVLQDAWQIRVPTKEEAEALRKGEGSDRLYGIMDSAGAGKGFNTGGTVVNQSGSVLAGAETENTAGETGSVKTGSYEGGPAAGAEASSGKININTADMEGLMRIPGIGESKARRILDYREKNGQFGSPEELMKVPGIKKASFEKMKDYIRTE